MAVNIIYYVHGTTLDNEAHKATGWTQGVLSEKGINQVHELKKLINLNEIDVCFSSDLKRAIDSADILFRGEKEIYHDERIRECNYGTLNEQDNSLVKYEDHITKPFQDGESLIDVETRMRDFCNYLKENFDGKTVAIVAHKAPQLALEVITKKLTWKDAIKLDWRKTKSWQPGWKYIIN